MKKATLTLISVLLYCSSALCQQADSSVKDKNSGEDKVFSEVEIEAGFPGGSEAFGQFIGKNINSKVPVRKKAPRGSYQVIVRFIVDRTGAIADVLSETKHGYGMEEEVIRVILKSPRWNPAMQNGRTVNAYRRLPVTFVVQ